MVCLQQKIVKIDACLQQKYVAFLYPAQFLRKHILKIFLYASTIISIILVSSYGLAIYVEFSSFLAFEQLSFLWHPVFVIPSLLWYAVFCCTQSTQP